LRHARTTDRHAALAATPRGPRRWTALSQDDAPSARKYTGGFWTGREVLVWGGAEKWPRGRAGGGAPTPSGSLKHSRFRGGDCALGPPWVIHPGMAHGTNGTRKLRVGIVGAGYISKFHVQAARTAGADVVAICDTSGARAESLADACDVGT